MFWRPFFDQNRKNAIFHFWEQKSGNELIFRFWSAFGAQNAPEPKSVPKSEKTILAVMGSKNVPITLCSSVFCAWSENDALSSFSFFCVFTLLGRKMSFWPPKVTKNTGNAKNPHFCAFWRKWPPKHLQKHCLEQHFWPMPVLSILDRRGRKSAFWGAKVRKCTHVRTFFQNR